jgi:tetratricopeptide (TPR) repeat protein
VVLVESGRFLMKQKRWAEASALLEAALQHGGEHYTGWYWLARARYRQRRYASAWAAAEEARRREPQHTPVLNFCADLAAKLGKLDEALACAEEHARLEPGSAASQARLRRLRARGGPSIGRRLRVWLGGAATKAGVPT